MPNSDFIESWTVHPYRHASELMAVIFGLTIILLLTSSAHSQINDQTRVEIQQMHWRPASTVHLEASHSVISRLPSFQVVTGNEALRFRQITDGQGDGFVEADAINVDTGSELIFQWLPMGYVRSDDWHDVDADQFLSQMQSNDEVANHERIKRGLSTIRTIGWLQKPNLNADTHTVSWVIEGQNGDGDHVINAVALKLGRAGIERITWILPPERMGSESNDLFVAEQAHMFDVGSRYTDYIASTDHTAEVGVAGLVAGALGVKLIKGGALIALLLGLKKVAFLLVLPFIWLGKRPFIWLSKKIIRPFQNKRNS